MLAVCVAACYANALPAWSFLYWGLCLPCTHFNLDSLAAQVSGSALSESPLTAEKQTAILTEFANVLPPLFLGFGPQWARLQAVTSDLAASTTNLTLLMDGWMLPIANDTSDTFPQVSAAQSSLTGDHLMTISKRILKFAALQ